MSPIDRAVLAERALALEHHLARVAEKLPPGADGFLASSDASDAVILHPWQATQIVIDLAVSACVAHGSGTPKSYADAFRRLETAGLIGADLADRLVSRRLSQRRRACVRAAGHGACAPGRAHGSRRSPRVHRRDCPRRARTGRIGMMARDA
jgi:uncharacterized protein YutE (UPF0331/DUF86 family)